MINLYDIAFTSNKGDKDNNEDFIETFNISDTHICILADGLGGFNGGEIASKLVVKTIVSSLKENFTFSSTCLINAICSANEKLIQQQKNNIDNPNMSSTIVALMIHDNKAIVAHAGDSRLYHFRDNIIKFITKDHSLCQLLVDSNQLDFEDIPTHIDKNKITKALGQSTSIDLSINEIEINLKEDSFLLCSDGVWENLNTNQLELNFCKSSTASEWLDNIEKTILSQASFNMDNYSMICIIPKNKEILS